MDGSSGDGLDATGRGWLDGRIGGWVDKGYWRRMNGIGRYLMDERMQLAGHGLRAIGRGLDVCINGWMGGRMDVTDGGGLDVTGRSRVINGSNWH